MYSTVCVHLLLILCMPHVCLAYRLDSQKLCTDLPTGLSPRYLQLQGLAKGQGIPRSPLQEMAVVPPKYVPGRLSNNDTVSIIPDFDQKQRAGNRRNKVCNNSLHVVHLFTYLAY